MRECKPNCSLLSIQILLVSAIFSCRTKSPQAALQTTNFHHNHNHHNHQGTSQILSLFQQCSSLLDIAWHCSAFLSIALHCSALLGIAWHCMELLSISQHCWPLLCLLTSIFLWHYFVFSSLVFLQSCPAARTEILFSLVFSKIDANVFIVYV